jgi:AcrR family transcriptional regulator
MKRTAGADGRSASSRAGAPAGHTALLQAAREEFAERGYDGTSIRQIAQRAGMSLSVLYHYYPGKTELLQAIVDEAMDAYFGACEDALAEAGDDPVRRLSALVTATIRFRAAYPSKGSLIQGEEHAFNEEFLSHYRKRAALGTRMFSDVVEAGLASGAFRTPYPEDARRAVIAMCNAVGEWYDPRGALSVDEIAQRYVTLALTVLECRPAARTRALRTP